MNEILKYERSDSSDTFNLPSDSESSLSEEDSSFFLLAATLLAGCFLSFLGAVVSC